MDSETIDFRFPLTPFGAAGYTEVSGLRLFITSLAFALICSAVFVWAAYRCYVTPVTEAFSNSSDNSSLAEGVYTSGFNEPFRKLGSNLFLEIWAAESVSTQTPHTSHLRALLAPQGMRFSSQLGYYMEIPYPQSWFVSTSKKNLESFWAGTKGIFPVGAGISVCIFILSLWAVVSVFYSIFTCIFSMATGRFPGLSQCYKMSLCGCYFGGIVFSIAVILYATEQMSLMMVAAFIPGQALAAIFFLSLTVLCLPKTSENPAFSGEKPESDIGKSHNVQNPFSKKEPPPSPDNPFTKSSGKSKSRNPFD